MKNKITLITHYFEDHVGGVESAAHFIAESISNKFEITWFASRLTKNSRSNTKINHYSVPCINFLEDYFGIPFPIWSPFSFFPLWQNIKSSDIVHIHDYIYMGNILGFIFAKLQKKPILITQHIGMIPYKNPLFRTLLSFLNTTLGKFILSHADKVIFSNTLTKDYFTEICRFQNEPLMILNGVNDSIHFPNKENKQFVRKEFNLPIDKLIFLFVGRFVEKKGLHIIKKLVKQFNQVTWILVGEGPIPVKNWNYNNLILTGNCNREKLNKLYQAADLLILPSKGEGLPLSVQESMSCGTPCLISSDTVKSFPKIENYVLHAQVEGENVIKAWNSKIEKFINNKNTLPEENRIIDFANKHWSIENCLIKYEQTINEIITLL